MGDIDASEVRQFGRELAEVGPRTSRRISGSLTRHVNRVVATARANAPKDTGELAAGIRHDTRTLARRIYSPPKRAGERYANVGMHVEYGTEKMRAQPFLTPALAAVQDDFVTDVERIIDQSLDR